MWGFEKINFNLQRGQNIRKGEFGQILSMYFS